MQVEETQIELEAAPRVIDVEDSQEQQPRKAFSNCCWWCLHAEAHEDMAIYEADYRSAMVDGSPDSDSDEEWKAEAIFKA